MGGQNELYSRDKLIALSGKDLFIFVIESDANIINRREIFIMKINNIMKQARQMQTQMMQIQENLAHETVEASVGGGMVTATFTGQGDITAIKIDPEVINPDDKDMLEDLIISAVNEGLKKSRELMNQRMGSITGALGAMMPGF